MHARSWLLASAASLLVVLSLDGPSPTHAQSQAALSGVVSSAGEPAMEGVLVTVKQTGSKRATTVVTGSDGRYQFPRARLEPGAYAISIRAVGYDLASEPAVSIAATGTTTANLTLRKAHNLASQLTNSEWLASFPGTDQQRASVRGCAHCHTMELVTRSKHNVESFTKVVERMSGYPPLAFPLMPQRTPAPRIGPGAVSREQQLQGWRTQAEYLSTLNLGTGTEWNYPFKTFPRPTGAATRVIYTEYRPARAHAPAARRDRGFVGHRLVRRVRRADHRQDGPEHRQGHRVHRADAQAGGAQGHPRDALRRGREPVARRCSSRAASRSSIPRPRSSRSGACRRISTAITCRSTRSAPGATRWTARCGCRTPAPTRSCGWT